MVNSPCPCSAPGHHLSHGVSRANLGFNLQTEIHSHSFFFFWTAFKEQAEGKLTMHKQSLSCFGRLTTLRQCGVDADFVCEVSSSPHQNAPKTCLSGWGTAQPPKKVVHKRTRAGRSAHAATTGKNTLLNFIY